MNIREIINKLRNPKRNIPLGILLVFIGMIIMVHSARFIVGYIILFIIIRDINIFKFILSLVELTIGCLLAAYSGLLITFKK